MTLIPGTRLDRYEIRTQIGAGGMGEVYRAHDQKLNRDVAIKVLPASLSQDADRLRRFEQEAQAAGALNHPNILAVYDVGTHDGSPYIVAELLDGGELREQLNDGAIPPRKAIDYAQQIAKGLAAAHAKGIIHRDLKPENLFLTTDGRVKILDFGLAKLRPQRSESATSEIDTRKQITDPGTVMGTVGYMSPEQVRGKAADTRSDIFAFGAILYEMLSGRRAFKRETGAETMTAILKEEPPELPQTNPNFSPGLERVVRRCVEKEPEQRFQSASDLAFAIEALTGNTGATAALAATEGRKGIPWRAVAGVALVGLAASLAAMVWTARQSPPTPKLQKLTFKRGMIQRAHFSSDGQGVVYAAAWDGGTYALYSLRLGSLESRPLGQEQALIMGGSQKGDLAILLAAREALGSSISKGTLARMPQEGGAPREILEDVQDADMSPDGQQFAVVRQSGTRQRLEFPVGHVLYETDGYISHPRISPRGDNVAFHDHPRIRDDRGFIAVSDLDGNIKRLTPEWPSEQGLMWSRSGDEIWFCASAKGEARELYGVTLSGKVRLIWRATGQLNIFDMDRDGRVLIGVEDLRGEVWASQPGQAADRNLTWLDWAGTPLLDPDGKLLFFSEQGAGSGANYTVFMRKTDGSPAAALGEGSPVALSHNGRWVLSQIPSQHNKLLVLPTGAGEARSLVLNNLVLTEPQCTWLPGDDGFYLTAQESGHAARTYKVMLDGSNPVPVTEEGYAGAMLSPDGRTLVVKDPQEQLLLYDIPSQKPRPLPGVVQSDQVLSWDETGGVLYLRSTRGFPIQIVRLEVKSGRRQPWKTLSPADLAGIDSPPRVQITPKGDIFAYSFIRVQSTLYVVEGLR
jgi:eukaryotic-like serine/threonine-protein kinase